jgi:protein-L-isoaspartate(D-aspartate) O-methyltransferase
MPCWGETFYKKFPSIRCLPVSGRIEGEYVKPEALRFKKDIYERARSAMVEEQLVRRGIRQQEVLDAMRRVPRHLFVDPGLCAQAYGDTPLPIGDKQTISQPYIVALMTEALKLKGTEKVLEIGTGSGYQSAVLALLAERVFSVERISSIASAAKRTLDSLHCANVVVRLGDGTLGWPEEAPFDAIIVTAGAPDIPPALMEQLKTGGRLVIPVGTEWAQELLRITKGEGRITKEVLTGCMFVKLKGKYGWQEKSTR